MDTPNRNLMINEIVSSLKLVQSLVEDALVILHVLKKGRTALIAQAARLTRPQSGRSAQKILLSGGTLHHPLDRRTIF